MDIFQLLIVELFVRLAIPAKAGIYWMRGFNPALFFYNNMCLGFGKLSELR